MWMEYICVEYTYNVTFEATKAFISRKSFQALGSLIINQMMLAMYWSV